MVLLGTYRGAARLVDPLMPAFLRLRAGRGKEDPARMAEKLGRCTVSRPPGPLVWIHGASVGESVSALPLIDAILTARPGLHILITTGTVTSANVMTDRLPDAAVHQYGPVDTGPAVARFYEHWRPDLGLIMESELWPNLLGSAPCPLVLVNARLSRRSHGRWKKSGAGSRLFSNFKMCLAQDRPVADRLKSLGAPGIQVTGNLKYAAASLPVNESTLNALRDMIGDRPVWLAASTHEGEEDIATSAHRVLHRELNGLLTVIAPRHPERGAGIDRLVRAEGLHVARRGSGDPIAPETDIYVADTMGETGLLYSTIDTVFMGGSLVPHGGQNPLESAQLRCAVSHGPHIQNFQQIYDDMDDAGAATPLMDAADLQAHLRLMLTDRVARNNLIDHAGSFMDGQSEVLQRVMAHLEPLLPAGRS